MMEQNYKVRLKKGTVLEVMDSYDAIIAKYGRFDRWERKNESTSEIFVSIIPGSPADIRTHKEVKQKLAKDKEAIWVITFKNPLRKNGYPCAIVLKDENKIRPYIENHVLNELNVDEDSIHITFAPIW